MDELETLFIEQIPRLRRYAYVLTQNKERRDDLVQDSLERAWRYIASWKTGTNLRAWLFTIMHNVYVNDIRRMSNSPGFESLDNVEPQANIGSQEQSLMIRDLMREIDLLPQEQREVLLLVAVEGMKYDEVAEICSIPMGTVTSRLHRAREHLRKVLSIDKSRHLQGVK